MKQPDDYQFLNPVWADVLMAYADAFKAELNRTIPLAFEDKVDSLMAQGLVTQDELNHWVYPLKTMSYEKVLLLSMLQNEYSQAAEIVVRPKPQSRLERAFTWTVIHLKLLELPGFTPEEVFSDWLTQFSSEAVVMTVFREYFSGFTPYHQCYWCGKVDFDADRVQKRARKYCHVVGCEHTTLSNPSLHMDCCQGKAALARRNIKEKLRTYRTKPSKNQQEMAMKTLSHYCEERIGENLNKEEDILNEEGYRLWQFQNTFQQRISKLIGK